MSGIIAKRLGMGKEKYGQIPTVGMFGLSLPRELPYHIVRLSMSSAILALQRESVGFSSNYLKL